MRAIEISKSNNLNLPKLRFKNFKDDWKIDKLNEKVVSISSGKLKPLEFGEFPVYGSTGIIGKCVNYSHDGTYILIARVGANAGQINSASGKFGVTDNTLVIDLKPELNQVFCEALLTKYDLKKLIFGSGQPLITGGLLKSLSIKFPSLPEQQKIASFLSAVDRKIHLLKRKKELLEQYKKGVMQQLFSRMLRFKDEEGRDFPEWEEKILNELLSIKNGLTIEQNKAISKFKVTRIETISNGIIDLSKVGYINPSYNIDEFRIKKGDILFSNINSVSHIAKTAIAKSDLNLYHGMNLLLLRSKNQIVPLFLFYFLNTSNSRKRFKIICNQAVSQASINQTELRKTKILLPTIQEQNKISQFLEKVDTKIDTICIKIKWTEVFKKSLLQQMFV